MMSKVLLIALFCAHLIAGHEPIHERRLHLHRHHDLGTSINMGFGPFGLTIGSNEQRFPLGFNTGLNQNGYNQVAPPLQPLYSGPISGLVANQYDQQPNVAYPSSQNQPYNQPPQQTPINNAYVNANQNPVNGNTQEKNVKNRNKLTIINYEGDMEEASKIGNVG